MSSPATLLGASSYKSRIAIRSLLKTNKRPIGDEALIALLNSIEEEQFLQFLDVFAPKTSLRALNEPVKTLTSILQVSEDLVERMYEFWKSTSNVTYNQEAFTKWFFEEKHSFLELNNDLINISYDSENPLSEKIKPLVERMVGKKLYTKILSNIESIINREEKSKFNTLQSLLKTIFLLLYQQLRKEPSFARDVAFLLPKIFRIHYLPQDQPLINYIFDLTAIVSIELIDFESLRNVNKFKVFTNSGVVELYDEWRLAKIDPSNSLQGLGLMTWCFIAQVDSIKEDLGTRAYQGGALFRLYSILSNNDLMSSNVGLMCKTIIKDFVTSFLSSFDTNALGNLDIITKCLVRLFSGEEKLSLDFFDSQDRAILEIFSKKFPRDFADITKILASLANGPKSNDHVYSYLEKMNVLCLNRTPDRGLVKEILQDGVFNLVVSKNFEVLCNKVGFYLISGTKGTSYEEEIASQDDSPTVLWQMEYSGWHYLIRLIQNNPKHPEISIILSLLQKIYSPKLMDHLSFGMPMFTDVRPPDLSLSALNCIVLNLEDPAMVHSALELLNRTPVTDQLRIEFARHCVLLNSIFEIDEDFGDTIISLPIFFCEALNIYSKFVKKVFLPSCNEDLERLIFNRLFGYLSSMSFVEGEGLELFCTSILNLMNPLKLSPERSLTAFEFAVNCINQNINHFDEASEVISKIYVPKETYKKLVTFEVVEKILENSNDPGHFITHSLERNHLPLSPKSIEFLADLLLKEVGIFVLLLEKWPQIILSLFSSSFPAKFSSAFVSLLRSSSSNDKLTLLSEILNRVWSSPTSHYLIICKLRNIKEFWKAIEEHISKSGILPGIKANLLRLYSSEVRLEPNNSSIYEFITTNPELIGDLLRKLDPTVNSAFIDLLESICSSVPVLSDQVVEAIVKGVDAFVLKHPDLINQGIINVICKYSLSKRELISWEHLTILFVERLHREFSEFSADYFTRLSQANVMVSKSLLLQGLSLCCHLGAKETLLPILEILLLNEEYFSTEIIHIIHRDRVIPILMAGDKLSQDVLECFIRCGENASFAELLTQNGVVYAHGVVDRSLLLKLLRAIGRHGHTETLLGALFGIGLDPLDDATMQTISCLLGERASLASPVVSSFVGSLIPVIFSTLRKIVSEGSGDPQPYVTFLKGLQRMGFVQEEHISNGVDQVYDPPIPYRDILRKVTVK